MWLWRWKAREEEEDNGPMGQLESLAELLDERTKAVEQRLAILEVQASVAERAT